MSSSRAAGMESESTLRPEMLEWAASSKQEPSKIGFLDLPRELRDLVYYHALRVPGAVLVQTPYIFAAREEFQGRAIKYKGEGFAEPERLAKVITVALVRTCRQIHSESILVLYGRNIFNFPISNANFAIRYRSLIRNIVFAVEAGRGIYSNNEIDMSYWWRRVYWPNVLDICTKLLQRYPGLSNLTSPIKSENLWRTWRPAFMLVERKTSKQRIDMAALWLRTNCPIKDQRLQKILHMEIMPARDVIEKDECKGSRFVVEDDDGNEWNYTEFASAFEQMKKI
ncbi:hypothetical protein DM02DRAFT_727861 [Periconia macrospinosa]|uniref:DUF7730 domain-containing protein n=1 Tax=Periconia macrospinosa TaxID=97972 RepID=A0A2V1DX72_9PLEO|nr:hypothetical protein DM02DRAFT_727861 [Periconia macrospinosa]